MGSPIVLNFDVLLKEIPGADPAGVDLRTAADSVYWVIRGDANSSRDIERKCLEQPGNDEYSLEQCKWDQVAEKAAEALATQSKDLEVAAWFCEALLRRQGFAGLRDGLRLTRRLVEQYWDSLYPRPTDGTIAERLSQFRGLFRGALVVPIKRVTMTERTGYSLLDYDLAKRLEEVKDAKERQARIDGGKLTLQGFEAAVRDSSNTFYEELLADLRDVGTELDRLAKVLVEKCQPYPDAEEALQPPREVIKALQEYDKVVTALVGSRLVAEKAEPAQAAMPTSTTTPVVGAESGELSRDAALKQLRELAEFFRKIEPHSPIASHIQEAVRWGSLSLPELLMELVPEEKPRKDLFTRIGITDVSPKKS